MVWIDLWEDFESKAKALFLQDPDKVITSPYPSPSSPPLPPSLSVSVSCAKAPCFPPPPSTPRAPARIYHPSSRKPRTCGCGPARKREGNREAEPPSLPLAFTRTIPAHAPCASTRRPPVSSAYPALIQYECNTFVVLQTRYTMKYRQCDQMVVLKVTDDKTCLKYKTNQQSEMKNIEKLNNIFFGYTAQRCTSARTRSHTCTRSLNTHSQRHTRSHKHITLTHTSHAG